jgi:hypothetical protein
MKPLSSISFKIDGSMKSLELRFFHLWAGLGELIDDGLNAFAVLVREPADKSLAFGAEKNN